MNSKSFVRSPTFILEEKGISSTTKMILAVILDKTDDKKTALSYSQIAKCAGCSTRQAIRSVEILLQRGYINVEERNGKSNIYSCNDILPQKKRQTKEKRNNDDIANTTSFEEYKSVINKFLPL